MLLTYTNILARAKQAVGNDTSTATESFLIDRINERYETIKAMLEGYTNELTKTFSTVADQQYYSVPPDLKDIESLEVTIGSVKYPLDPIFSYNEWNRLNAIQVQETILPRNYFRRKSDFGIYPIPQGAYTSTLVYTSSAQPIYRADYTTGTVTATENSQTLTGSGTTWSGNVYAGQWFSLADSNGNPRGNWYKISSVDSNTSITLETFFEETTEAGADYIIGDVPDLPSELHKYLYYGAAADYFAELQQAPTKAQSWDNRFWTGSFNNSNRDARTVRDGVLGVIERYKDRDNSQLVNRGRSKKSIVHEDVWSTDLS